MPSVSGSGSAGCEKTPLKVQDYMGYKSTEDPLYKADKLMVRAAPLVDPDDFENFLEVVEKYKDKADNTAMMVSCVFVLWAEGDATALPLSSLQTGIYI